MITMTKSAAAYGSDGLAQVLKQEIESLDPTLLPLQENLTQGSVAKGEGFSAVVLRVEEDAGSIRAKVAIFYAGVIAGCACADDPTPQNETAEYCEVVFVIQRDGGDAQILPV